MTARVSIAVLLAGFLAATITGCGGSGAGGGVATVTGRVVDDGTQAPVANATARVGNTASAQTGADGRFTINDAPTGNQMLSVTAGGHDSSNVPVTLSAGQNSVGTVYLAPTLNLGRGAVTGRLVLASNNSAVSGGIVQSGTISALSRADGSGRFTLYNVPAGSAQVNFYDPSTTAGTIRFNVPVSSGQTTDLGNVLLSFGPPPPPL
ncbi:MAG: carboxypeptidase-like regulatory domain-containing protein [Armatimonadetes bacterium]|nr:carboxypeptidase-like regulatory domain-containing protein [Armatimonadota bacterium]